MGGNLIERADGDYLMPKTGNARKRFKSGKEQLILYFYKVFYRNSKKEFIEYVSICSLLFYFDFKPEMRLEKNGGDLLLFFLREEWRVMGYHNNAVHGQRKEHTFFTLIQTVGK